MSVSQVENCSHNCESCGANCPSRNGGAPTSFLEKPHEMSSIKKVIGVVSGKGGVGKSMVTSMLAVLANRRGYASAILDADVTGPSIPKAFGIHEKAMGTEMGMFPARSKMGIEVMSVNMLLENETDP
ncbi:MAG: P-loop NTPase, partial [Clostridiales bacterium]|nr:P-loop NTPase [Clostridiales bacterium]